MDVCKLEGTVTSCRLYGLDLVGKTLFMGVCEGTSWERCGGSVGPQQWHSLCGALSAEASIGEDGGGL